MGLSTSYRHLSQIYRLAVSEGPAFALSSNEADENVHPSSTHGIRGPNPVGSLRKVAQAARSEASSPVPGSCVRSLILAPCSRVPPNGVDDGLWINGRQPVAIHGSFV